MDLKPPPPLSVIEPDTGKFEVMKHGLDDRHTCPPGLS